MTFLFAQNDGCRCGKASRLGNCSLPPTTLSYLSSRLPRRAVGPQGRDLQFTSPATNTAGSAALPIVILRGCDFSDLAGDFAHPIRCFQPPTKPSSCLPRRAVGAKRLADLSYNEGLTARSRRTPAMLVGRCCSELSGHKHKVATSRLGRSKYSGGLFLERPAQHQFQRLLVLLIL